MPFVPFQDYCRDVALAETRSISVIAPGPVPEDSYALLELYCDEPGCDCRRVLLSVLSRKRSRLEAVIGFGWESEEFYARWFGENDPLVVPELKGPVLNLGSPQSELAPALLEMVDRLALQDPHYVARLQRHYRLFRERIDCAGGGPCVGGKREPPPANRAERRRAERRGQKRKRGTGP